MIYLFSFSISLSVTIYTFSQVWDWSWDTVFILWQKTASQDLSQSWERFINTGLNELLRKLALITFLAYSNDWFIQTPLFLARYCRLKQYLVYIYAQRTTRLYEIPYKVCGFIGTPIRELQWKCLLVLYLVLIKRLFLLNCNIRINYYVIIVELLEASSGGVDSISIRENEIFNILISSPW